ncbi:MAG: ChbG/HpnK family deacetylase [Lachnospiraceae bacterium]|jgi:hypothetical protein|nr:ChbG/HpnK family deacetylase [Lachnospiraceae bacterium]
MKSIRFIARVDDAGSSHAANLAIGRAIKAGFIKNVSLMAPGPFIKEAAQMFAGDKKVCFGMHGTLNAEWDRMKWKPVLPAKRCDGLLDDQGYFLADPVLFDRSRPSVETALAELSAQLDRLTRLGFNVSYLDSHMFAEAHIPGLDEAIAAFAVRKGLIDHMYYYRLPPGMAQIGEDWSGFLRHLPGGQYFYVAHPAVYGAEMLRTGNATYRGIDIARGRGREAKLLGNPLLAPATRILYGVRTLRYDQARPLSRRLTVAELGRILS